MERIDARDPEARSADIVADNLARLETLFPEAFSEGRVDLEVLRQLLGDAVAESQEKYGLNWHGKRRARQLALTPSSGTLRPCPEDSVDWNTTQNLMIEGDNLEVLKLLQKSYAGKVKAIYIDPPYNTGRNLVYPNDYTDGIQAYLKITGQVENGRKLSSNTESGGRFHSNWLSMVYPRLHAAKALLRQDGILYCTVDENEHATLSLILKEIFSEGTYEHAYITIVHNPRGQQGKNISYVHENAVVIYRADGNKYLADVAKSKVDSRNLRDSGTESNRTDARNCFYPFVVSKSRELLSIGDVPPDSFHPEAANVPTADGGVEIWPMTDAGDEKKWRYARHSVDRIRDKLEPKMGRNNLQIIFHKDIGTMRSVWSDSKYDASEYGTKLVESLIGSAGFTYPKSLWAVYDSIKLMTADDPEAIVMDFFAGSGTTAHAVWELNRDTGGRRRVILVQLPEPLNEKDGGQRAAAEFCRRLGRPANIAEITKERLRRVASGKEASSGYRGDRGFRVFRLDRSNIRAWNPAPDDLEDALLAHLDHLEPGRSEQDILYELVLKLGLDLCAPIETRTIAAKPVHAVGGGKLIACLDEKISCNDVEGLAIGIADWHDTLAPAEETTVVFRDNAFSDDIAKTNLAAILEQRELRNVRSL